MLESAHSSAGVSLASRKNTGMRHKKVTSQLMLSKVCLVLRRVREAFA